MSNTNREEPIMSRFTSVLCTTLLATSIAACDKDVLSSPEISSPIGSSKSSTVCDSGCTSNYDGLGVGGDTVWMAFGTDAIVAPLSGVSNMIIRSVTPLDPKTGVSARKVDDWHIDISASARACEGIKSSVGGTSCTLRVSYMAAPPGNLAAWTKTITVMLFMPPAIGLPIDTVRITAGETAIVDPVSGVSNLVIRSVTPLDPTTGVRATEVDSTHVSIATSSAVCSLAYTTSQPTCAVWPVTYVVSPPGSRTDPHTGTIVVVLLTPQTPPTIQNVAIPVGYTSWAPMLVPASQFATDMYGTPLTVIAATAQTSVAGLTVSVVNGQLAVTRIPSFFSSGGSVQVSVTVSDGTTSATGFITLTLL
jgi:hypothetical protein